MSDVESAPRSHHEEEENDQNDARADNSDKDSDALSDIDEDQFDDYDPNTARIDEKRPEPQIIDDVAARTLKAGKRKGTAAKKPKEGRRAKKRSRDNDNDGADGEILNTKRARKAPGADAPEQESEVEEENLTPEERRRRAIERAARNQPKPKGVRRKKKDEVVCHKLDSSPPPNGIVRVLTRRPRIWKTNWMSESQISKSAWKMPAKQTTKLVRRASRLCTN